MYDLDRIQRIVCQGLDIFDQMPEVSTAVGRQCLPS